MPALKPKTSEKIDVLSRFGMALAHLSQEFITKRVHE